MHSSTIKTAGLKDAHAHYEIANMYFEGLCVEKNLKMEKYHLEEAAIGGYFDARYNLGCSGGMRAILGGQ